MTFLAERHSPYFRRSLDAWLRRPLAGFELPACLETIVNNPVDRAVLDGWLARFMAVADSAPGTDRVARALRRTRSLLMLALIERDLRGCAPLQEVCSAMTSMAELAVQAAQRAAAAELAQRHGLPLDGDGQPQDLLTVGMGKCGGNELNVSSDLDVVFVHRDDGETAGRLDEAGNVVAGSRIASAEFMHRLARRVVSLLDENTADGFVFRVDTRLRPNGDSGPMVVSLSMLENYFYSQGREWERFAWIKGRVIADSGLAGGPARVADEQALQAIVTPFVFRRYLDFKAFAALRSLHSMIRAELGKKDARYSGSFDVKLGVGGIREIEFTAQLFQIVRGGRDPGLRDKGTLATLAQLATRKLLSAQDVEALTQAYQFLRRTEHALQYVDDAQTHRLPADLVQRAAIAQMLGLSAPDFMAQLVTATTRVDQIFSDLLHGEEKPERSADAEPAADLSPELVRRLEAMRGGSRYRNARPETRQAIEQVLDAGIGRGTGLDGLVRLIDLLEAVSGRGAYVALLAQFPQALDRVLRMLTRAKWAADYLTRHPILLDELLDGQLLDPVDYAGWAAQVDSQLAQARLPDGSPDVERQMDIVREAHHAQVFRLLAQDLEDRHTVEHLSDLLSELADRVLDITIRLLWSQSRYRFREQPRFAAIAYGRLGSKELGYASDLDIVFLYDDDDERAPEAYAQLAQKISGWLSTRTAAGMLFEIDLRLRPNGNAGLLVTRLQSFVDYQRQSAWIWEHQALSRARFAAGDEALGRSFEAHRREILVMPRDPRTLRDEVVAMRRKMHEGHPNKTALFDIKHDSGGMVDIEFLVQYLVLRDGARLPQLLDDAGNIALLGRAAQAGLISEASASAVADAYRRYRKIQHLMRLNDAQYARVEPATVAAERAAVTQLWQALLAA